MSVASEITRLQTAKADLKTAINAKTDAQHQITNETIDEYADFVDSISSGGSATLITKSITANGIYNASSDSADGYSQVTVNVPTGITPTGTLSITDNGTYDVTNYASANVNVSGGISTIDVNAEKLKFSRSSFTTIPSYLDFSNVTDFSSMFTYCIQLTTVSNLNTNSATSLEDAFKGCSKLTSVSLTDTSKVTVFNNIFNSCEKLTTFPQMDTSRGVSFNNFLYSCDKLTTVPQYDFSSVTTLGSYFAKRCPKLTTLGGFVDLGEAYLTSRAANYTNYTCDLSNITTLTHDSLMNVINKLYDIKTKGCKAQQLILGSTNLAKLTAEEIAIATNKGWSVS